MPDPLISLGLAKNWIAKLWKQWSTIRSERRHELLEIEREFVSLEQLEMLAKLYVEPECQATNPADHDEDEPERAVRQPIHKWINGFLKGAFRQQDGRNTVFVLSDAGMGKSSLLMMLKLSHLSRFWPEDREFKLLKLGPKTLETIDQLADRGKTVLLLDALDEDTAARGRIEQRLAELLAATQSFRQVILTCRTQFFPKGGDAAIEKPWKIEVGGYICNLIYLSPFSDEQVDEYLRKIFPDGWRERLAWLTRQDEPKDRSRAWRAVGAMSSLRMRPMLLAHINDLMDEDAYEWTEYRVYHTLIERWLLREERKQKGRVTQEELLQACTSVALHLQPAGQRELPLKELDELVDAELLAERLDGFDFGGRSLLNRTSEQGFRFAHYSIQEFLVAHALVSDPRPRLAPRLHATDQILSFLTSWLDEAPSQRIPEVHWGLLSSGDGSSPLLDVFRHYGSDLRGARLRGISLRGADLREFQLRGADLREADLREANLRGMDLSFACFAGADLRGARLRGAMTLGTNFLGARGFEIEPHRGASWKKPQHLEVLPRVAAGRLNGLQWSPAGHLLALGTSETIEVWAPDLGRRVKVLKVPGMTTFAWISGCKALAVACGDEVRILDPSDDTVIDSFAGLGADVTSLAWSQAHRLACGLANGRIIVWDAGVQILNFQGHNEAVSQLAWGGAPDMLASGSQDRTVRVWAVARNEALNTSTYTTRYMNVHENPIHDLQWGGPRILIAAGDEVSILDTRDWTRSKTPAVRGGASRGLAVAPDGDRLAVLGEFHLKVWSLRSGRLLEKLEKSDFFLWSGLNPAQWSPDGEGLAIVTHLGLLFFDRNLAELPGIDRRESHSFSVARHNRGAWVASISEALDEVTVWDVRARKDLHVLSAPPDRKHEAIFSTQWSPVADQLAADTLYREDLFVWKDLSGKSSVTCLKRSKLAHSPVWNFSGNRLAARTVMDGKFAIWDPESGSEAQVVDCAMKDRIEIVWDPKSGRFAGVSEEHFVEIWNLEGEFLLRTLMPTNLSENPTVLAWSPEGDRLAVGYQEGRTRIWDMTTFRPLIELTHESTHRKIVWQPQGDLLAAFSEDYSLQIWDPVTGRMLSSAACSSEAQTMQWSPTGILVTTTLAGTIEYWRATRSTLRLLLTVHEAEAIRGLAVTPDGYVDGPPEVLANVRFSDGWALYELKDVPERRDAEKVQRIFDEIFAEKTTG